MANISKILMLESELCGLVRAAESARKRLEAELSTLSTEDRKLIHLIPVSDEEEVPPFEYHGDAQKANGTYFRWWVEEYGAGQQCINVACPTILRGPLHFVVERFCGAGY